MDISQERFNEIKDLVKEKGMKITYRDFTKSEVEYIISETILSEQDIEIAKMKYLKLMKNVDIFVSQHYWDSLSSCDRHIWAISKALKITCQRIFK